MHFECIRFETGAGIARISLNRPERLNAFNQEMLKELREALDHSADDAQTRVILITGCGRGFCAGQDLTERKTYDGQLPRDLGESLEKNYHPLIRRLRSLEKPVLCAVNGVAAGAGASFALACDLVIASKSASFIQAFSRIGLTPDCGSSYFLPRLVGEAKARALAFTGDQIDAETAERWGMIWLCVADEELQNRAETEALKLSKKAPLASAETKKLFQQSFERSLEEQLKQEGKAQQRMGRTEDYHEGVQAFLEKRPPQFKGK